MRAAAVDKAAFRAFCGEVQLLASVRHPNIVKFVGYNIDLNLLILMEFVPMGSVEDYMKQKSDMVRSFSRWTVGLYGTANSRLRVEADLSPPSQPLHQHGPRAEVPPHSQATARCAPRHQAGKHPSLRREHELLHR